MCQKNEVLLMSDDVKEVTIMPVLLSKDVYWVDWYQGGHKVGQAVIPTERVFHLINHLLRRGFDICSVNAIMSNYQPDPDRRQKLCFSKKVEAS